MKLSAVLLSAFLLLSCASTESESSPQVNNSPKIQQTSTPEKVEVSPEVKKPLAPKNKEDKVVLPKSIAILPFKNVTDEPAAPQTLRNTLYGHLASSNYRFPHIKDIDNRLAILDPNQELLYQDAQMLTNLLDVDGLMFAEVLNYDKLFAGIYAQITFEVKVTLVNRQGEVLWQQQFEEISREGGVSANALSLLYSIAMTAMHLTDENLLAVADKLGRKIANDFPQPTQLEQVTHSFIDTVLHDGADKVLKYGDMLQVGIKGEANKIASVSIEGINQIFPLKEQEPGIYLANIAVDHRWNASGLMLTGMLRDSSGTISKYISSVGLLDFDNQAPDPVKLTRQKIDPSRISIHWQKAEPDLLYQVFNIEGQIRTLIFETYQSEFVWDHDIPAFETLNISVIAQDKAGNQSNETLIQSPVYPLSSMYNASRQKQARLPSQLTGQLILRRNDGPFIIDQKVQQEANSGLYIEPGTEIQFTNSGNLLIQGSVFSFSGEAITLKPLSSVITAQTFISLDSTQHVELNSVHIERAGIGIEVLKGKPVVSDCVINNSQYSAIVVANNAHLTINHCIFSGSNTSGLIATDQARVRISESEFINNFPFHIQSSSIYQLEATGNRWQPEASVMSVLGNVRFE